MLKPITADRLAIVALCACLAACGSAAPVAYQGVPSSPYLAPNHEEDAGRVPYRYATPVDWRAYDRIIIDPVAIYRGPDQQFEDMSDAQKTVLARYMEQQFAEKLRQRFALARDPAAGTLRLRLTLTGAAATTPVLGPFTRFDLSGGLYNAVQAARGGEGLFTGAVFYVAEIYDAPSNRLLAAFVAKQYPGAYDIGATFGSLGAAKTGIEKGADALAAQLSGPARL